MSPATQDTIKQLVQNAVQQAINAPSFMRQFTHHKAKAYVTFPQSRITYIRVRSGKTTRTFRVVVSEVMTREGE